MLPPNVKDSFVVCILGALTVYLMASIYAITMRGVLGTIPSNHTDFFRDSTDVIAHLASSFMTHKDIVASASKLTACSLWTCSNLFVPIKHMVGLAIGPMNVWISAIHFMTGKDITLSRTNASRRIIFNALVLVTCTGIPSLSAAACLCMVASCFQTYYARKKHWKSKMSI